MLTFQVANLQRATKGGHGNKLQTPITFSVNTRAKTAVLCGLAVFAGRKCAGGKSKLAPNALVLLHLPHSPFPFC